MRTFTHESHPVRVVFGRGSVDTVGAEVAALGRRRVLLLASARLGPLASTIEKQLGPVAVARFDDAAMHTPTDVTARAMAVAKSHHIDCVVAIGGGSTTGLSKALAVRGGYDQIVVPTTYAGSEMTPVLGETDGGVKTTRTSEDIRPETVVYDVDLTVALPQSLTLTSAINAMAHAVEGLYAADTDPVVDLMALDAIRAISRGLPRVMEQSDHADARTDLLQAAWLAGSCLGSVAMGVHHKLCHTLGGSFGLPHAGTHTVVLPHAMAYNAPAVPDVMEVIAGAMGVADAPTGMYDLIAGLGGPISLAELGFRRGDIPRATELATARPYANPRSVTAAGLTGLLTDAVDGRRPDAAI